MDQDGQRLPLAFSMCDLGKVPSLSWVSVSIPKWSLKPTLRSSCSFPSVLGPYLPLKERLGREDILNRHSPSSVFLFSLYLHNACPHPRPIQALWEGRPFGGQDFSSSIHGSSPSASGHYRMGSAQAWDQRRLRGPP